MNGHANHSGAGAWYDRRKQVYSSGHGNLTTGSQLQTNIRHHVCIFETGQSPEREQIRIDLPLFIITPGVPLRWGCLPETQISYRLHISAQCFYDGKTEAPLLLSNMDAVVAREFKNELPTIITKTLIASAIKAGATYGDIRRCNKRRKKNAEAGLAVLIAGAIYQCGDEPG